MRENDNFVQNLLSYAKKYRQQLLYLIFGFGTTAINYGIFWLLHRTLGDSWDLATNVFAFLGSVAFAYVTNKIFVFRSRSWSPRFLIQEFLTFLSSRIFSFLIEELGLYVSRDLFHVGQYRFLFLDGTMLAKLALSVLVVILNYFLSKYLIFRK